MVLIGKNQWSDDDSIHDSEANCDDFNDVILAFINDEEEGRSLDANEDVFRKVNNPQIGD